MDLVVETIGVRNRAFELERASDGGIGGVGREAHPAGGDGGEDEVHGVRGGAKEVTTCNVAMARARGGTDVGGEAGAIDVIQGES